MTIARRNYQFSVFHPFAWSVFAVLLAGPAQAESIKLSGAEITATLSEKEVAGTDNGQPSGQIFRANGATFYAVAGNSQTGNWKVEGDKYCSVWPPSENWVCYDVLRDGNAIQFISPSGKASTYTLKP